MNVSSKGTIVDQRFTTVEIIGDVPSNSSNSGALIIRNGGIGVAGDLNVGGSIQLPEGTLSVAGLQLYQLLAMLLKQQV